MARINDFLHIWSAEAGRGSPLCRCGEEAIYLVSTTMANPGKPFWK